MAYRFNNFQNLKSQFYPSDKQVKIFSSDWQSRTSKCQWALGWLQYQESAQGPSRIIKYIGENNFKKYSNNYLNSMGTLKRPKGQRYVSNEIPPKWTKISSPPETKYDEWQSSRLKKRGADYHHGFFKTRLSASTPNFMQIPRLEPEEFKRRKKKIMIITFQKKKSC